MARGSVTKRGEAWRIAVELEPDGSGKRRQRFETFRGSKRDADKRLTELLSLADQQKLGITSKQTVSEYLAVWLRDGCADLAPKTIAGYRFLASHYVEPRIGSLALGKVATATLVALFRKLRESPRGDGRDGHLSPSTVRAVYRMLHTAFSRAVKWNVLVANPLDGVDAPSVPRVEMKSFTVEQAQAFLSAAGAESSKWQSFFSLALLAGCRPGELKALRWTDLDLVASTFSVQRSAQRIAGVGVHIGPTKTNGSRRPVAIGSDVVALLRHHRVEQSKERLAAGPFWQDQGLCFPSELGSVLEDHRVRDAFVRICERAGVPRIRVYDLRHTSASLMLAAGVNPRIVSERLGHSTVNLTLNVYAHVLPGQQANAADMLESLVRSAK